MLRKTIFSNDTLFSRLLLHSAPPLSVSPDAIEPGTVAVEIRSPQGHLHPKVTCGLPYFSKSSLLIQMTSLRLVRLYRLTMGPVLCSSGLWKQLGLLRRAGCWDGKARNAVLRNFTRLRVLWTLVKCFQNSFIESWMQNIELSRWQQSNIIDFLILEAWRAIIYWRSFSDGFYTYNALYHSHRERSWGLATLGEFTIFTASTLSSSKDRTSD